MAFSWNSVLLSEFKLLQKNLLPKQNCLKFFIVLTENIYAFGCAFL